MTVNDVIEGKDGLMACTDAEYFMRLALAEAQKGLGRTSPNPPVGAVIVHNGVVVGRGYHHRAGTPHAEINALADARAQGFDPRGAALYVTLEPCNHAGRTPPCTEALLAAGIAKLGIGTLDPNFRVKGGGAEYLRSRGILVEQDILRAECRELIAPFAKRVKTGLPWVLLKAGMSLDARISRQKGKGAAITGEKSRRYTHKLRDQIDAIIIGIGTALADDPLLTTRLDSENTHDPLRVIMDSALRLSPACRLLSQHSSAATWVFCGPDAEQAREEGLRAAGARVIRVKRQKAGLDLKEVLRFLGEAGICSLLVEGGAKVHAAFLRAGLVDEVALFLAPCFIGEQGTPLLSGAGPFLTALRHVRAESLGQDILIRGLASDPDAFFSSAELPALAC